MSEELEKDFLKLGFTSNQFKLYTYLLKCRSKMFRELPKSLGMTRVQIYRALKELEEKGLIEKDLNRPHKFKALSAKATLAHVIKMKKQESIVFEANAKDFFNKLEGLELKYYDNYDEGKFKVVTDTSYMAAISQEILKGVRDVEVHCIFYPFERVSAGQICETMNVIQKNNCQFKLLTTHIQASNSFTEYVYNRGKTMKEFEMRSTQINEPTRFFGLPNQEITIFLTPPDVDAKNSRALWTTNKYLLDLIRNYWDKFWENSKPMIQIQGK